MPTQQELMIMRLVGDMKSAIKRSADESDSEESVHEITNRGNKLKKKAKFVREGQLALPNGPETYKKTIVYNDFEREILSERPPLYDDDGYEMSSEDDEDGEAQAAANEFYPYNEVKIEELLAPLMSASDLPDHPTLSRAFTSTTLTELTNHARMMAQKEKNALWRMKHLFTKLSGDHTWIPTAMLETPDDLSYFGDGRAEYRAHLLEKNRAAEEEARKEAEEAAKLQAEEDRFEVEQARENADDVNGQQVPTPPTDEPTTGQDYTLQNDNRDGDVHMGEAGDEPKEPQPEGGQEPVSNSNPGTENKQEVSKEIEAQPDGLPQEHTEDVSTTAMNVDNEPQPTAQAELSVDAAQPVAEAQPAEEHDPDSTLIDPEVAEEERRASPPQEATLEVAVVEAAEGDEALQDDEMDIDGSPDDPASKTEPRRMRTRAQAAAVSPTEGRPRSLSSISNESFIHPYFLPPLASLPEHDFMLPSMEAEETRRLLQLYIQKQEEIVRGSEKLYMGLLEADRGRKKVMSWARADGHVGEMSDGEDWVDEQEWNLDGPLRKGQDEEEEDTVQTSKKTRTRRQ